MTYTIKPLEWKYDRVTQTWLADTAFGFLSIYESGMVKYMTNSSFPDWHKQCKDVEDAKLTAWIYWVELIKPILKEIK